MKLLVTGGAGYGGSVTSRLLLDAGHEVVVLDNLRTGFREAVAPDATFVEADIADAGSVLTPDSGFDAVLHFAGLIAAGESMVKPELYWDHNVIRSLRLLEAVLNEAAAAYLVVDEAGVVTLANVAARHLLSALDVQRLGEHAAGLGQDAEEPLEAGRGGRRDGCGLGEGGLGPGGRGGGGRLGPEAAQVGETPLAHRSRPHPRGRGQVRSVSLQGYQHGRRPRYSLGAGRPRAAQ